MWWLVATANSEGDHGAKLLPLFTLISLIPALYHLAQLTALIKTRLKRMQYRPGLLAGFLASTGLDLAPFGNLRG